METINWSDLSFSYIPTDYNVRCYWRNGEWGELEVSSSEYRPLHRAATCLHYGQEAFEGLKAFKGKDGKMEAMGFEVGPEMLSMMGGFTVLRLFTLMGGMMDAKFTKEQLLDLNKKLNKIKAPKKK